MRCCHAIFLLSVLAGRSALGGVKVQEQPLTPEGEDAGCVISPTGEHAAVIVPAGSRYEVRFDAQAGLKIDGLLTSVGFESIYNPTDKRAAQVPIVFSDNGAHWAYMARSGEYCVVVVDGKELSRQPIRRGVHEVFPLSFSAGGKHVFWSDLDAAGYHIVVDGVAGPALSHLMRIAVSADGNHYAYVRHGGGDDAANWAIVDGKRRDYFGELLQYDPNNALITAAAEPHGWVLADGGRLEARAVQFLALWTAADGSEIAAVTRPNAEAQNSVLTVNGKPVPEATGLFVEKVYFSPDGRRWAALCDTPTGTKFMVIDGKKELEYARIPSSVDVPASLDHWKFASGNAFIKAADAVRPVPGFTADSSRFIYVASNGARQFLVTDEKESEGFDPLVAIEPVMAAEGHRVAAVGMSPLGKPRMLVDGAQVDFSLFPDAVAPRHLSFSPLSTHYAYVQDGRLYVDHNAQPGTLTEGHYAFSPDDAHIAYAGIIDGSSCMIIDGTVVSRGAGAVTHVFFSPDGRHVFWSSDVAGTPELRQLYVDGEVSVKFADAIRGVSTVFDFSPEGELHFIARSDEGKLMRFAVARPSETNLKGLVEAGVPAEPAE